MAPRSLGSSLLGSSAALLGAIPLAYYVSLALARVLPFDTEVRVAAAYSLPLPLYVALACAIARVRSPGRAWLLCLGVSGLLMFGLATFAPLQTDTERNSSCASFSSC